MQDFWKLLPKKSVILSAKITKKENKCDIRVELWSVSQNQDPHYFYQLHLECFSVIQQHSKL